MATRLASRIHRRQLSGARSHRAGSLDRPAPARPVSRLPAAPVKANAGSASESARRQRLAPILRTDGRNRMPLAFSPASFLQDWQPCHVFFHSPRGFPERGTPAAGAVHGAADFRRRKPLLWLSSAGGNRPDASQMDIATTSDIVVAHSLTFLRIVTWSQGPCSATRRRPAALPSSDARMPRAYRRPRRSPPCA
jgi:hypothetical protein